MLLDSLNDTVILNRLDVHVYKGIVSTHELKAPLKHESYWSVLDPPGGGYFRNFWVGMGRWDPGTLNLYQS